MVANKKSKGKKRRDFSGGSSGNDKSSKSNAFAIAAASKGSKRKFPVLGQVSKSSQSVVGKDKVSKGDQSRKSALLIEYRKFGKSNLFVDRRFGEYNSELSAEDKAIARLQKTRRRQLGKGRFALTNDDDQLTHMGRSLAEIGDDKDNFGALQDDDDDNDLDKETVARLHFGGGDVQENSADKHRTKKEVMEEIISKSKAGKAMKAQQKEEDAILQEELDDEFKELIEGPLMSKMIRPTGVKSQDISADDADAAYDRAQRSLVFGARAQPGERTKTADEIAVIEAERLEKLERERIRRMHTSDGYDEEHDSDGNDESLSGGGGYAARRKRRRLGVGEEELRDASQANHVSGDAEDDFDLEDDGSSDDNEEAENDSGDEVQDGHVPSSALEARRQIQAAGDHELQQNFRVASAQLLMKYGISPTGKTAEELGEDEDEEDEDGSGESDDGMRSEEDTGKDEEAEEDKDGVNDGSGDKERSKGKSQEGPPESRRDYRLQMPAVQPEDSLVSERMADIPYTIKAPSSYQEFARLVSGCSSDEITEILRRIRTNNALALGQDNRRKLQVFYGILVQHFVLLAGESPLPLATLDAIAAVLQPMTAEVPFYAATVAQARLSKVLERLSDTQHGDQNPAVLPVRSLLLLKLITQVFPTSDARHPVMTPMALIVGAALSRIIGDENPPPVNLMQGIFLSQLANHMTAQASRFYPEAIGMCCKILEYAGSVSDKDPPSNKYTAYSSSENWQLHFMRDICRKHGDPWFNCKDFKTGLSYATLKAIDRLMDLTSGFASCPEIMHKLGASIDKFERRVKAFPQTVLDLAHSLLRKSQSQRTEAMLKRKHMTHTGKSATVSVKTFNPRFEDDYAKGRDYDPDRAKADERRLKKEVNRERRATVRGLRKDSIYTANIRDSEKKAIADDRHEKAMSAISWLQSFEANMKSGGQGGMHKGSKKSSK